MLGEPVGTTRALDDRRHATCMEFTFPFLLLFLRFSFLPLSWFSHSIPTCRQWKRSFDTHFSFFISKRCIVKNCNKGKLQWRNGGHPLVYSFEIVLTTAIHIYFYFLTTNDVGKRRWRRRDSLRMEPLILKKMMADDGEMTKLIFCNHCHKCWQTLNSWWLKSTRNPK